jgi:hypothetical protein
MSYMKNKIMDVIEMLEEGYSPSDVADFTGLGLADVLDIMNTAGITDDSEFAAAMDGDFDTAMASAGFGTDEDYGYYGS